FFPCYGAPLAPPSFPTRRSSDLLAVGIQRYATPVQFVAGMALMTAANGFQSCQQFGGMKGLAQIIIGAGFQAIDPLMPGIAGGQNHHWGAVAGSAPAAQHFQAVFTGQTQVQNDQVGLQLIAQKFTVDAVMRQFYRMASAPQPTLQGVG